jgi:3-methylcrotonyl-CoA carboxylase alpha subunit
VDDSDVEMTAEPLPDGHLRLTSAAGTFVLLVTAAGDRRFVHLDGMDFVLDLDRGGRRRAAGATGSLEAPMPGLVTRVMVGEGDAVRQGQPLLALEAMKMEHVLRAPRDGRVKRIAAAAGEMVAGGLELVELEEV